MVSDTPYYAGVRAFMTQALYNGSVQGKRGILGQTIHQGTAGLFVLPGVLGVAAASRWSASALRVHQARCLRLAGHQYRLPAPPSRLLPLSLTSCRELLGQ